MSTKPTENNPTETPASSCSLKGGAGAFTVEQWFTSFDGSCETLIRSGNPTTGERVASTFIQGSLSDPKANLERIRKNERRAKLMAAAPDLFRELQHLVSLLEPIERDGGIPAPGLATLNGARAALSKAKGQQ